MIDIYESRRFYMEKKEKITPYKRTINIYPETTAFLLDIVTCLNMSCKYNEIYPPDLSDICQLVDCGTDLHNICEN